MKIIEKSQTTMSFEKIVVKVHYRLFLAIFNSKLRLFSILVNSIRSLCSIDTHEANKPSEIFLLQTHSKIFEKKVYR